MPDTSQPPTDGGSGSFDTTYDAAYRFAFTHNFSLRRHTSMDFLLLGGSQTYPSHNFVHSEQLTEPLPDRLSNDINYYEGFPTLCSNRIPG